MRFRKSVSFVGSLFLAGTVYAQPPEEAAFRSDWIPSGDYSDGAIGDLWTFVCPSNGTVSIWLDTEDDTGVGTSNIDPFIEVVDRKGSLLSIGDNSAACSKPSVCATSPVSCPRVIQAPCGAGNPHSIVIYSAPSAMCAGGGGYKLWVSTTNKSGKVIPAKAVRLGGGSRRIVPKWADDVHKSPPALDDEGVPSFAFPGARTFSDSLPGYTVPEITLEWDESPSEGTDGYRVLYGVKSKNYTMTEDVGSRTTHTFRGLNPGTTYYFAVVAYNSETSSILSNEVSTTIPLPPE